MPAPLMLTLAGVGDGVALTKAGAVVLLDAAQVADEAIVLVQVVIVLLDVLVIVAFLTTLDELELKLELVMVVTLMLEEVVVISSADEVDEEEVEVVDVCGTSETSPPVTL